MFAITRLVWRSCGPSRISLRDRRPVGPRTCTLGEISQMTDATEENLSSEELTETADDEAQTAGTVEAETGAEDQAETAEAEVEDDVQTASESAADVEQDVPADDIEADEPGGIDAEAVLARVAEAALRDSDSARANEESDALTPLVGAVTKADVENSTYALVVLAAKRAKQLRDGARPMTGATSNNVLTVALNEMRERRLGYRLAEEDGGNRDD